MNPSNFHYPAVNLAAYSLNFTGQCLVTYCDGKEFRDSTVFIVDIDRSFEHILYDEFVGELDDFPAPNTVFVVDVGPDGIHRAVYSGNDTKSLFYIDCGEVVQVKSSYKWKLRAISNRAQQMSARAIPCNVIKIDDEFGNEITDIDEVLYEQVWFTIVNIDNGKLDVVLRKTAPPTLSGQPAIEPQIAKEEESISAGLNHMSLDKEEIAIAHDAPPFPANNNQFEMNEQRNVGTQLTKEEEDELNEIEPCTTNAMKAVMGYSTTDEKRTCKYTNPKTGRCFKGNSCRLEHVMLLKDGWTRDRQKSTQLITDYLPLVGSTVKVCVTCVLSPDEFYAHIPEIFVFFGFGSIKDLKASLNADNMIKQYEPFVGIPDFHDLVLVLRGNAFYRGLVVDNLGIRKSVIQFVDYGFEAEIERKDIYKWHPYWDHVPAQSHRCKLANVRVRDDKMPKAMQMFKDMVINKDNVFAKIIQTSDFLYVNLYNGNGVDVGDMLHANGLAELKAPLVPTSTQLPG